MKFKTKPCEIEAIQWNFPFNTTEILDWAEGKVEVISNPTRLSIKTLEGIMTANNEDFIIKGLNGEFYPCKPDIFNKKYEQIN